MRISDWSSDVCSSDLHACARPARHRRQRGAGPTHRAAAYSCSSGSPIAFAACARQSRAERVNALAELPICVGRFCVHIFERLRAPAAGGFVPPLAVVIEEIGRASCRERVCQYVLISEVAGSLKKKKTK